MNMRHGSCKSNGEVNLSKKDVYPFSFIPIFWSEFAKISISDKDIDFKFGTQHQFDKSHHKITRRGKVGVTLRYGSSQKFGHSPLLFLQRLKLATLNLVCSLGLSRPFYNKKLR